MRNNLENNFKNPIFTAKYPVKIKRLRGTLYRPNKEPACNENRATVLMPGIVKLLDGNF